MGIFDKIKNLFGGNGNDGRSNVPPPNVGRGVDQLARRLGVSVAELQTVTPEYHQFTINKRSGGLRTITAPSPIFKAFQRRLLQRLFKRLPIHPAAMGFCKGRSIADHALLHAMRPVVVKMDIRDFFPSTSAERVNVYFRRFGWNEEATQWLTNWTTYEGGLPQGAPTSPLLSNAVNYHLDSRLSGMVRMLGSYIQNPKTLEFVEGGFDASGFYSRYADDLTISFEKNIERVANQAIYLTKEIVEDEGYKLHTKKKLRIMRNHDRQMVTGLVINEGVRLPRETRRWLRAVRHRESMGRQSTLTAQQLAGWTALENMVDKVVEKQA